jgi:YD repeat-containing protein
MKKEKMKTPPFSRITPLAYSFTREVRANGSWMEVTKDEVAKIKTVKHSDGFWYEEMYDANGYPITFKDSNGFTAERVHDKDGNVLAATNSDGEFEIRRAGWGNLKAVSKEKYDAFINAL